MLHGNNNDSRIEGESSGWVEVASKNNLILTSIERPASQANIEFGERLFREPGPSVRFGT